MVKKARFKHSVFYRTLLLFFIPAVLVSFLSLISHWYYLRWFKNSTIDSYVNGLRSIAETTDSLFLELYHSHTLLSLNADIREMAINTRFAFDKESLTVIGGARLLGNYRVTREILDAAYLYHRSTGIVLTEQGTEEAGSYLGKIRVYAKYPASFWASYEQHQPGLAFLEPSDVTDSGGTRQVIPVVQDGIGPLRTECIFVIDVRVEELQRMLEAVRFTEDSVIIMTDGQGDIFASIGVLADQGIDDETQLVQEILPQVAPANEKDLVVQHRIGREDFLLITYNSRMSLKDFLYVALVPMADIYARTAVIRYVAILMMVAGLMISFVIALFSARRSYRPVRELVYLVGGNEGENGEARESDDEYDYVSQNILLMLKSKRQLEQQLSRSLPLAHERCFVRILRDEELQLEGELRELLREEGRDFIHDDFCAVMMRLDLTKEFVRQFSREERSVVLGNLARTAQNMFPKQYRAYLLSMEKTVTCAVINVPSSTNQSDVEARINQLHRLLAYDSRFVNMMSAVGGIHVGLSGLHESYREARVTLSLMMHNDRRRVQSYRASEVHQRAGEYSLGDEGRLMNLLITGRSKESVDFARKLMQRFTSATNSVEQQCAVCSQLRTTARRALDRKQRNEPDIMGYDFDERSSGIGESDVCELQAYVLHLLERTAVLFHEARSSIDIAEILDFIQKNYSTDIYLDVLAERYHTSSKYLSRILHGKLGIPFYQYLSSLRIGRAKSLLLDTEETVTEIARIVGFSSNSAFFRMFKRREGITPKEFRIAYGSTGENSR